MQSDDVIWSIINTQFCSYKVKYATFLLFLPMQPVHFHAEHRLKISVEMNIM